MKKSLRTLFAQTNYAAIATFRTSSWCCIPITQLLQKAKMPVWSVLVFLFLMGGIGKGWSQINMTTAGSNSQNFNTLITTGTGIWTDNSTIANWYSQRTGTGTTIMANSGGNNAGNLYSYGTGTTTERALGTVGSSNLAAGSFAHGVLLKNTSGAPITDIKVTYTLEQWRNSADLAQALTFYYKTSSSIITTLNPNLNTGWTQVAGLTLSSPITGGTAGALNGDLAANRVTATNISIPSLSLANNDYIMLKWEDPDHSGTDHGMAIEDVTIAWTVCTPPTTSSISGPNSVCANSGVGYSVAFTPGSTYTWTVTGGTTNGNNLNTSVVNWNGAGPGNVSVVETNSCGAAGAAVNLPVTINPFGTIVCPMPYSLECTPGLNMGGVPPNTPQDPTIDPAITGMPTTTSTCGMPFSYNYQDILVGPTPANCPNLFKVNRTWTATDMVGNMSTCTQVITLTDNTDPYIQCQADLSYEMYAGFNMNPVGPNTPQDPGIAPIMFSGYPFASDNCGNPTLTYQDVLVGPGSCPIVYHVNRTWKATDNCGHTATCVQVVNLTDTTNPSITCPSTQSFEWIAGFNMNPVGADTPQDPSIAPMLSGGVASVSDNAGSPVVTYQDVLVGPTPGTCPILWHVDRTWKATDNCGFMTTCVQVINFTDTTPPSFGSCPIGNVILPCNITPTAATAISSAGVATDNCGSPSITTSNGSVIDNGCNHTQAWQVIATDNCGNQSTCSLTLSWTTDTQPPTFTTCPAQVPTPPCQIAGVAAQAINAVGPMDNCSGLSSTATQTGPTIINGCSASQLWTVTATDGCNNTATCQVTFFGDIATPVTITCPPTYNANYYAGFNVNPVPANTPQDPSIAPAITGLPVVVSDCSGTLQYSDVLTSTACPVPYTVTRHWQFIDVCGLSHDCTQSILIHQSNNLVCPANITLCNSVAAFALNAMPAGGTYTGSTGIVGGNMFNPALASIGVNTITYTYTDPSTGCTFFCNFTITVNAVPTVGITNNSGTTFLCTLSSISLTATGGPSYMWENASTNANRVVSSAGTYSVTVTDANGCSGMSSIMITQFINVNTDYFRSKQSGNWNSVSTWESSHDGVTWCNATMVPNVLANTITLQAPYVVVITTADGITADDLVVEAGAKLNIHGLLTIPIGSESGLANMGTVETDGVFQTGGDIQNLGVVKIHSLFILLNPVVLTGNGFVYDAMATLTYKGGLVYTATGVEFPNSSGPRDLSIDDATSLILPAAFSRTISGDLVLDQAALLNDGGNTITVGGNLLGNFTGLHIGSGKIIMNGPGSDISDITLQNLEIAAEDIEVASDLTINGNLTLASGSFVNNGHVITVHQNLLGTGVHFGPGHISMDGANATIAGTSLGNVELNNSYNFSLGGSATISSLTLNQSQLHLGAFDCTTQTLNGSNSNCVITDGTGKLRMFVPGDTPTTFWVGAGGSEGDQVIISPTAGSMFEVGVKIINDNSEFTSPVNNFSLVAPREWNINPLTDPGSTFLSIYYYYGNTLSDAVVGHYSMGEWTEYGAGYDIGNFTAVVSSFSPFGVGRATGFAEACTSPIASANPDNATICENENISFQGSFTGGDPTPTYVWQVSTDGGMTWNDLTETAPYSGTTTFSLLISGVPLSYNNYQYRLKANNTCGDVFTASATLTVNPLPAAGITNNNDPVTTELTCTTTSINVTATGGTAYEWSGGATTSTANNTFTSADTYTVTVTDANSCSSTASITITLNNTPPAAPSCPANFSLCSGDVPYQLTIPGGGVYTSNDVGMNAVSPTGLFDPSLADIGANVVTYTITDVNGCTNTCATTITVNSSPVIIMQPGDSTVCQDQFARFTVGVTGGTMITYQWQFWDGMNWIDQVEDFYHQQTNTNQLYVLTNGVSNEGEMYRLAITDSECGVSYSDAGIIHVNANPVCSISPLTPVIMCPGTTMVFTASPGMSNYFWLLDDDSDGTISGPNNQSTVSVTANNTCNGQIFLLLSIQNANGCSSNCNKTIQVGDIIPPTFMGCPVGTQNLGLNPPAITAAKAIMDAGTPTDNCSLGTPMASGGTITGTCSKTQTWTVTVSDACGNLATCQIVYTWTVAPVVTCPAPFSICSNAAPVALTASPIGGTYSGSTGIAGNMFNPALAPVGANVITYNYTDENGCSSSCTFTITVLASPTPDAGEDFILCGIDAYYYLPITLSANATSGAWTSSDPIHTMFVPGPTSDLTTVNFTQPGTYTLTWTETNGTCTASDDVIAQYDYIPLVEIYPIFSVCGYQAQLNAVFTGNGGVVWAKESGPGGATFSPNANSLNPIVTVDMYGEYVFKLTGFNGPCSATAYRNVTFVEPPAISCPLDVTVCQGLTSNTFLLSGTPSGGEFFGDPAITNNGMGDYFFNPFVAGPGVHTVHYSITDGECTSECTFTITVFASPEVTCPLDFSLCEGSPDFNLTSLTYDPVGGVFSGDFVDSDSPYAFHTVDAGVGMHDVTYTVTSGNGCSTQCTFTITVLPKPALIMPNDIEICHDEDPFELTGATPTGGTYSGPGVADGIFSPADAGVGSHTILYEYADPESGCIAVGSFQIFVQEPPPTFAGEDDVTCALNYDLSATVSGEYAGLGEWSGTGPGTITFDDETNPTTNVTVGNEGVYTFIWTENLVPCFARDTVTIQFGNTCPADFNLCLDGPDLDLTTLTFDPPGGTFSGTGVTGNLFSPSLAGIGMHVITYTSISEGGCVGMCNFTITINALPVVDAGTYGPYCVNQNAVGLLGSPSGGIFSGTGVQYGEGSYYFLTSFGTQTITYTYTDAFGCTNTDMTTIVIFTPTEVTCPDDIYLCTTDGPITLGGATPPGGNYLINGNVQTTFDPSVASPGIYVGAYQYVDENNCQNECGFEIFVSDPGEILVETNPGDQHICQMGEATFTATFTGSNLAYQWEYFDIGLSDWQPVPTGAPFSGETTTTLTVTNPTPNWGTDYRCVAYTGCGSATSNAATLTIDNYFGADAGADDAVCSALYNLVGSDNGSAMGLWTMTDGTGTATFGNETMAETSVQMSGMDAYGTKEFTWTITNGLCISSDAVLITFNEPAETPFCPNSGVNYCSGQAPFQLTSTPPGGVYTSNDVGMDAVSPTGLFNPALANIGVNIVKYTITDDNGCTAFCTDFMIVNQTPATPVCPEDMTFCTNDPAFQLTAFVVPNPYSPSTGIANDGMFYSFYPDEAGAGVYPITYTVTDGGSGCSSTCDFTFTVNPLPVINTCPPSLQTCLNAPAFALGGGIPNNGVFSGDGVSGGMFDPAVAGLDFHSLTYTITDAMTMCTRSCFFDIEVLDTTMLECPASFTISTSDLPLNLTTLTYSPVGGNFSGTEVVANIFNTAMTGVYTVHYNYPNVNGCTSTCSFLITVTSGCTPPSCIITGPTTVCPGTTGIIYTAPAGMASYSWNFGQDCFIEGDMDEQSISVTTYNICGSSFVIFLTVTDASGCTQACQLNGNLNDNQAPQFSACPSADVPLGCNPPAITQAQAIAAAGMVTDNCHYNSSTAAGGPITGTCSKSQTWTVTAYDDCGNNSSCAVTFTWTSDTQGPVFDNCPQSATYLPCNVPLSSLTVAQVIAAAGTVTDDCGVTMSASLNDVNTFGCSDVQYWLVTATDACGLQDNCLVTFVANTDTEDPVLTCQGSGDLGNNPVDSNDDDIPDAVPSAASWTDNCSGTGSTGTYEDTDIDLIGCQRGLTRSFSYTDFCGHTGTCSGTYTWTVIPEVMCPADITVCSNDAPFALTGGSPVNGVYSGVGVAAGMFNPASGNGAHLITYTYTDGNGCSAFCSYFITVKALPTVTCPEDQHLCSTSPAFSFAGMSTPLGGVYDVDGQVAAGFDPDTARTTLPPYLVTYTYTTVDGCTSYCTWQIYVNETPDANAGNDHSSCTLNSVLQAIPSVGSGMWTYTGPPMGVITFNDGVNDPNQIISASLTGTYVFTWTETNGPCVSSDMVTISFISIDVTCPANFSTCSNTIPFALTGGMPAGGTYSGDGVDNMGVFNPAVAGVGMHTITYSYLDDNTGCSNFCTFTITVYESPNANAGNDHNSCSLNSVLQAIPSVGTGLWTYTGPPMGTIMYGVGATAPNQTISASITGTYVFTWTETNGPCVSSDMVTISFIPIDVTCPGNFSTCSNTTPFALTGGMPAGGTYSGDGVDNMGVFNPAVAGDGMHTITYSYLDDNTGCSNFCTFVITVAPPTAVNCPPSFTVDISDAPFVLTGGAPVGGTYSGTGVTSNSFYPLVAGLGPHVITYSYTGGGCTNTCQFTITVVSEGECTPKMEWVFLPPGFSTGSCPSMTNCCTNTICYGLQYTPGTTGILDDYTTGFIIPCPGSSPIISNNSCVMNNHSFEISGCGPPDNLLLFNSSGNEGVLPVFACVPVILHKVCFDIPIGGSIPIVEDEVTDLTSSILVSPGNTITEFPVFTATTITRTPPVAPADGFMTVACPQYATQPAYPVVLDYCGSPITATVTSIVDTPDPLTCEGTRKYTFTYATCETPAYTFLWHFTYTIERNDFMMPADDGAEIECPDFATAENVELPVVRSDCQEVLTPALPVENFHNTDTFDGCNGTISFTWKYTDCELNFHYWTYTYDVQQPAPSEQDGPVPTSTTIDCYLEAAPPAQLPTIVDACNNVLPLSGPIIGGTNTGGCNGTKTYTYTYLDCEGIQHQWVYTNNVVCDPLVLKVYLEGNYSISGDSMTTKMNQLHTLPGQNAPPFYLDYPAGQPYSGAPWNYAGNPGTQWGDYSGQTPYPSNVVDWVLVMIRKNGILPPQTIWTCAGWVDKHGNVTFPENCTLPAFTTTDLYYFVVQHRNHLGILSPVDANMPCGTAQLEWDFRASNSYQPLFRFGEKQVEPGVWAMFAANGEQVIGISGITSADRTLWKTLQGTFGYSAGDFDLDADTDSADENIWKINQNRTTGVIFY